MHSAWDSARFAEDGAIKVCTGHCTSSKICTVQGTVQENEYGGVSSFARGEILACTLLLRGATPCWGGGTVQLFGMLWMNDSLLLGLAYQP